MTNKQLRIGVLFGGRSGEHEVSEVSARSVMAAMDRERYRIFPIRILRNGQWRLLPEIEAGASIEQSLAEEGKQVLPDPSGQGGRLLSMADSGEVGMAEVDVFFPLLHGVFGEDGTVQGLLALTSTPYVGAEVAASALGMDKILSKPVFEQAGLTVVPFWWFTRSAWRKKPDAILDEIERRFGYPCFIKPANTGSSVGVAKAHDRAELKAGITAAAELDLKILIEQALDVRELECAVLGNDKVRTSVVGEVVCGHEFYDYEAKYIDEGTRVLVPADLPEVVADQVRRWAEQAFRAIDGCGMARVDFFLDRKTDRLYLNEINTIPGFTPRSMFPMLWQASGLGYSELVEKLIALALERYEQRRTTQGYE